MLIFNILKMQLVLFPKEISPNTLFIDLKIFILIGSIVILVCEILNRKMCRKNLNSYR